MYCIYSGICDTSAQIVSVYMPEVFIHLRKYQIV